MHHFTDTEQEQLERDGYVVREALFDRPEVDAMIASSEELVAGLVAGRHGRRFTVGSYTFEPDALSLVMLKWEGDSDQLHGIEPVSHLSEDLERVGRDPRLVQPMTTLVGDEHPAPFTEKLNLKRPNVGGPNPLHQDYPYWIDSTPDASRVATATIYLDETTLENGCLEVLPGSHRSGKLPTRTDADVFGQNEMDPGANAHLRRIPVPLPAGSVVYFGAFLAHATGPNRTDTNRRALLYSYQPPGHPHMLDGLRRMLQPSSS